MANFTSKPATTNAGHGVLALPSVGIGWVLNAIAHHFGNDAVQKVSDAISKARAAGIPWITILETLLPLILSIFSGGSVNIAAIIAAILALINPPTPAPTPPTPPPIQV